ncbi:MAG: hypothetical protein CHACPFDD_03493 [Phycisphaerae bacterium]|nr:hypothetical protein [Phycisphaerae bacterium]
MWTRALRAAGIACQTADDLVMPQTCAACGAWIAGADGELCRDCRTELATAGAVSCCPSCGRNAQSITIRDGDCRACRGERFWNVAGVARIGPYGGALRTLIVGLKYAGRERAATILARHLAASLRQTSWFSDVQWLVPVPMHVVRRMFRPCNHALLLAEELSRCTGRPMARAVRRIRNTPSQTVISVRSRRFENVKDCFAPAPRSLLRRVVAPRASRDWDLSGATVCIVDNLAATGATLCEVSKVLRRLGARRVYAAIAARSSLGGDVAATTASDADAAELS